MLKCKRVIRKQGSICDAVLHNLEEMKWTAALRLQVTRGKNASLNRPLLSGGEHIAKKSSVYTITPRAQMTSLVWPGKH